NLSLNPADLQSGADVVVSWTDSVTGSIPTPGPFVDTLIVTNLTTGELLVSTSVPYEPNAAGNGPIQPGGSRNRQYALRLPDTTRGVGQIQFTVTTNSTRVIRESDATYSNNSATVTRPSTLAPYPDLVVASLRVDPATDLLSGQNLVVRWD